MGYHVIPQQRSTTDLFCSSLPLALLTPPWQYSTINHHTVVLYLFFRASSHSRLMIPENYHYEHRMGEPISPLRWQQQISHGDLMFLDQIWVQILQSGSLIWHILLWGDMTTKRYHNQQAQNVYDEWHYRRCLCMLVLQCMAIVWRTASRIVALTWMNHLFYNLLSISFKHNFHKLRGNVMWADNRLPLSHQSPQYLHSPPVTCLSDTLHSPSCSP